MSLLSEIEKHGLADCEFNRQLTKETNMKLNAHDKATWIKTIWNALEDHRETCELLNAPLTTSEWIDICAAMTWITEEMEVNSDE